MNVLLFDLENGSKTLGSRETIQKSFGLPVLAPRAFEDFGAVLGQLYTSDGTEHTVKVGNVEIQEFRNERMLRDSAVPVLLPVIVKVYVLAGLYSIVELARPVIVTSLPETVRAGPVCDVVFVIVTTGSAVWVKIIDCSDPLPALTVSSIVYVSFVFVALPSTSIEGYSC